MKSKILIAYLFSGIVFGFGLSLSEMINPARVIAFLDVTGVWDPTLMMVMLSTLSITFPLFHFVLKLEQPLFANAFSLPSKKDLDKRLIIGAILFGIGWGLAGFCPGPAIAGLATLSSEVVIFVFAMFFGYLIASKI